ncbi:1,4-dihydroxy-2-naphthoate octaprenyltransferase [uncultured Mesonia sp.]|uniref:1,4-dihydroxy-2-naphthoate octaprenyltransferase n=1 Tax=uncultured Mesonia sp. TaxID=399731 RepID=UPI00374E5EC3
MQKAITWVKAARLRTLPLSISGILLGAVLAHLEQDFQLSIFIYALCTTLCLQILSNFANDYGDGVKGTDNEERVGPMRALQSGIITDKQMKIGMIFCSLLSLAFAVLLIYSAFGSENFTLSIFFFLLGIAAITAAIKYTVGKSAYGYRGLGDVFVFLFFGLVAVVGSAVLFTHQIKFTYFLPAIAVGTLSVAVLNLNNMRDRLSDANSNKNTLVVKWGIRKATNYHIGLILLAFLCFLLFNYNLPIQFNLALIPFILLFKHLYTVVQHEEPKTLDPELKKVALSTFIIALIYLLLAWI